MTAHDAAVEALAAALYDPTKGTEDGPSWSVYRARKALAALVRSEAVRAALVEAPCLNPEPRSSCWARGRRHPECILAALRPETDACKRFTSDSYVHAHDLGSVPCVNCGKRFQDHV